MVCICVNAITVCSKFINGIKSCERRVEFFFIIINGSPVTNMISRSFAAGYLINSQQQEEVENNKQ